MNYQELTSIENLFQAWDEFKKGKTRKADLQIFERHLEDNLFGLQKTLVSKVYCHGNYEDFYVQDPKRRHIHKAVVADRVVHHLLYKYLYDLFDSTFIFDSYSCRLSKGTHKAVDRLEIFTRKVSKNYTCPCWALKCDVRKFFASIDRQTLLDLLERWVIDRDILWLLTEVIESFPGGIPLGNLTSQIFANIYLDRLDQFIKSELKIKYYLRYADDFIMLANDRKYLEDLIDPIKIFLFDHLKLELHPEKVIFRKLDWGIDFLGYVVLPHYRLPRTKTKRRVFRKLELGIMSKNFNQSWQSYLGYLSHADSYKIVQDLKSRIWLLDTDQREN